MGSTINGSRSWISIAGMSIQPAEFAKLAVVDRHGAGGRRAHRGLLAPAGGRPPRRPRHARGRRRCPAALILLQPDLGTMLVLLATVFGVIAVSGAPRRWLLGLAVGGGRRSATPRSASGCSRSYQIDRFMAFTNPALDPRAPATTPSRPASRSATAASSARASSTARRPAPASCPSSRPTSSSPSRARSSAWSGPRSSSRCSASCSGGRSDRRAGRRPVRPAGRRRHRLLVRLPGVPEHRDVPGDHAGHRRTPAAGVVRRHARCSPA